MDDKNCPEAQDVHEIAEIKLKIKKKNKKHKLEDDDDDDQKLNLSELPEAKLKEKKKHKKQKLDGSDNEDILNQSELSETKLKEKKKRKKQKLDGSDNEDILNQSELSEAKLKEKKKRKKQKLVGSDNEENLNQGGSSEAKLKGKKKHNKPKIEDINNEEKLNQTELSESKLKGKKKHKKQKLEDSDNKENLNQNVSSETEEKKPHLYEINKSERIGEEFQMKVDVEGQEINVLNLNNGSTKTYIDLPYEEGERMLKYEGFWIKREDLQSIEALKEGLKDLEESKMQKKLMKAKKKASETLRMELHNEQVEILRKKEIVYEENNFMTCYDQVWIRKSAVKILDAIKQREYKNIIKKRTDGNTDEKLTEDELQKYRKIIKVKKRNESRSLKLDLISQSRIIPKMEKPTKSTKAKSRLAGKALGINYSEDSNNMAKFEGFWVNLQASKTLQKLKESLQAKGVSEAEISQIMKAERRKEEKRLKRERKKYCHNCHQLGHLKNECSSTTSSAKDCKKCGSTRHRTFKCKIKEEDQLKTPVVDKPTDIAEK